MNHILKSLKYGSLIFMCALILSFLVVLYLKCTTMLISYIFPLNMVESEIVTLIVTLLLLLFHAGWYVSE